MRLIWIWAAAVAFSSFPSVPLAQQPTIEQLEQLQALEDMQRLGDEIFALADRMTEEKHQKCLKVFGHVRYCSCLREHSPIGLSFEQYVIAVTTPKDELGYGGLSTQDRELGEVIAQAMLITVGDS